MARGTFNLRLSDKERAQLEAEARKRRWSLGRYIRYKALGRDIDQEQRIRTLEEKVGLK